MTTQHTPKNTREVMLAALAAGRTVEQGMDECTAFLEAQEAREIAEAKERQRLIPAPLRGNMIRSKR